MNTNERHPQVLWAQREGLLYLTVELHDAQDAKIDLTESSIDFSNTTDDMLYKFHLDFYKPINPKESKKTLTGRKTVMLLEKQEDEWWPRLTKDTKKLAFVKTDFDHWKDSDDSGDEEPDFSGMDFSQMGGMGGMGDMASMMGGMGGMGGMPDLSALAGAGAADEAADEDEGEGEDEATSKPKD
ncbi:p23 chaperone protein wos2 [Coemansia sp. RSA 989]|nr:p23 chaperone protein wos2 [Coemansia sp. RSA 989]